MVTSVPSGKYGPMNTIDSTIMGYYAVNFFSEAYIIQEDITCDGQISTSGELFFKAQYLICMKENIRWYWEIKPQQVIVVPTRTIVHPCIFVIVVKYLQDIPRGVINRNQSQQYLQRNSICSTESNNSYTID